MTIMKVLYLRIDGLRLELSPIIPQWAIDMEVYTHPNDIKTLVRVVNNLGQQVNPDMSSKVLFFTTCIMMEQLRNL